MTRVIDIRPGEWRRTLLAFSILLLTVASHTIVKSVREALFLSRFGITELSVIAIGLAALMGFVVALYLRHTAGVPRPVLIGVTHGVVATSLSAIWLGLGSPRLAGPLAWVLFIWSSVFGAFIVMQFWLLANDLFDAREAKRLFGIVGAGAIVGGVVGGVASRGFASLIGTRHLLLVAAAMLLAETALVYLVWPERHRESAGPEPLTADAGQIAGGLERVRRAPYLRILALAVACATVATTLLGWQFLAIAKQHFAGRVDEMTAFFGTLSAYLSVISLLIQTLFTGWLLRRFGVGLGLLGLPLALMLGSALVLNAGLIGGMTLLAAASIARVVEGGMRFAVDRACTELMWVPVPAREKEQGKAFVDTVMDRVGTGVAGLAWLLLAWLGLDRPDRLHLVSIAILATIATWLLIIRRARRGYVDAFRDLLRLKESDLGRLRVNIVDGDAQRMVAATLASADAREVLFALYLMEDWPAELPDLGVALRHPDPAVVQEALAVLRRRKDTRHRALAAECVAHAVDDVREAAIEYLRSTASGETDALIEGLARSDGIDPVSVDIIKLGLPAYEGQALDSLREALRAAPLPRRVHLLRMLGAAPPAAVAELVRGSLAAPHPALVKGAVFAAGRARASELVPELAGLLSDWRYRRAATEALRRIGSPALAALGTLAADPLRALPARQAAVRLLGSVGRGEAGVLLVRLAREADFDFARRALRALARLHARAGVHLEDADLDALVLEDVALLYRDLLFLRRGSWADLRQSELPGDLFERTLAERTNDRIERIFLALALRYDAADVRAAYRGLRSPLKSIRASGIEFLDNLLPPELKLRLIPLLESSGPRMFAALARTQEGLRAERRAAALGRHLIGNDVITRAVACWSVGSEGLLALRERVRQLSGAAEPLGSIARRALARLDGQNAEEPTMGLTTIEKALKLQKVDVLQQASTEDLAHIAQIAQELTVPPGSVVYREGDAPDALFVVVSGEVRLHRDEVEIATLGAGEAFGSWALVDESPRVASATVTEQAVLLRVGRDEFVELLADRVDIVQAVFRAMVARLRELAGVSSAFRETRE